ncbi:MAG: hypothetical protein KDA60_09210, partial [Planctomycetales bacterium]|nr:hypothetical protein [Planctomycetales bacterium]
LADVASDVPASLAHPVLQFHVGRLREFLVADVFDQRPSQREPLVSDLPLAEEPDSSADRSSDSNSLQVMWWDRWVVGSVIGTLFLVAAFVAPEVDEREHNRNRNLSPFRAIG